MGSSRSLTHSPWHAFAGQVSGKLGQLSGKSGQLSDAGLRICAYLRTREPVKTAEAVSSRTRLSADTFAKWQSGRSDPSGCALLMLVGVYGPGVLVAAYGPERLPDWLSDAVADDERRDIAALFRLIEQRLNDIDAP